MASSYDTIRGFLNPAIVSNTATTAVLEGLAAGDTLVQSAADSLFKDFFIKTARGEFLDYLGSNYGVSRPEAIGISDETYRKIIQIFATDKQTAAQCQNLLSIYFNIYRTNAYVEAQNNENYLLRDGDTLILQLDSLYIYTITFDSDYFENISSASASEVANYLNKYFTDFQINAIATYVYDFDNLSYKVRISTKTVGLFGRVAVLGGTAQLGLKFAEVVETTQDNTTQFSISNPSGSTFRYTWKGGTNPGLGAINANDYVVISGSNFQSANVGSFTISNVVDGPVNHAYFEVYNTSGTTQSLLTLSQAKDLSFFDSFNFSIQDRNQYGAIFETTPGRIDAIIPASTSVVERTPTTGGSYLAEKILTFNILGNPTGWSDISVGADPFFPDTMANDETGNLVIAVGASGIIANSMDGGLTWNTNTISGAGDFYCAAYADGVWIAGDTLGKIWVLSTGTIAEANWELKQTVAPQLGGTAIYTILKVNGIWLVGGDHGTIYFSYDNGQTWTAGIFNILPGSIRPAISKMATNGSRVVAVTLNGSAHYSDDFGATWTQSTEPFVNSVYDIAWAPELSLFVAVARSGGLASSPNGDTFTAQSLPAGMVGNWMLKVIWTGTYFATCSVEGKLATSSDGLIWTEQTIGFAGQQAVDMAFGNGTLIVTGGAGNVTVFDGSTWTHGASAICGGNTAYCTFTGLAFIAVGDSASAPGSILDYRVALLTGETVVNTSTGASGVISSTTSSSIDVGNIQEITGKFGGSGTLFGEASGLYANYSATPTVSVNTSISGSYIYDENALELSYINSDLVTEIKQNSNNLILEVQSTANFSATGYICLDLGYDNEEKPVPYVAVLNSKELMISPSYVFSASHSAGANVFLLNDKKPPEPSFDNSQLASYLTDVANARQNFVDNLDLIKAAGIQLKTRVKYPSDYGLANEGKAYSDIIKVYGPDGAEDTVVWEQIVEMESD